MGSASTRCGTRTSQLASSTPATRSGRTSTGGHGQTGLDQWGGDRSKLGRLGPGGHRATVDAVHRFGLLIRAARPGIPFILLGQSWGSLIAQILLNDYPKEYDAVVLTGTAYRTFTGMNAGDLNGRHKKLGSTGYEWLSRDPAVVAAAAADPLMFKASAMKAFGILDALRILGKPRVGLAAEHDVPVFIGIGSDDSLGGESSVRKLAAAYVSRSGLTDVHRDHLPGCQARGLQRDEPRRGHRRPRRMARRPRLTADRSTSCGAWCVRGALSARSATVGGGGTRPRPRRSAPRLASRGEPAWSPAEWRRGGPRRSPG